jgi:hypothetical protein
MEFLAMMSAEALILRNRALIALARETWRITKDTQLRAARKRLLAAHQRARSRVGSDVWRQIAEQLDEQSGKE